MESAVKRSRLNILIIEDESLLALEFSTIIESYGYSVVDYVTNSQDAIEVMKKSEIDLLLMDINLNEEFDGIDLYKLLNTDAYVIYLTAYKDDKTIRKAVETEPLGYLTKPLHNSELKALLQLAEIKVEKKKHTTPERIQLSTNYSFNLKSNSLYYKNEFVKLSAKKLQLLKILIDANGQAVSFKNIEDAIWKESTPSTSSLRTLIYRLRAILKEEIIVNEINFGIKLVESIK